MGLYSHKIIAQSDEVSIFASKFSIESSFESFLEIPIGQSLLIVGKVIEYDFEFISFFGGDIFLPAFIQLECFDEGNPLSQIHSFVDDI